MPESKTSFSDTLVIPDSRYTIENNCVWSWISLHCQAKDYCPRPSSVEIFHKMTKVNQKIWILARMLKLWSIFAEKYDIKWMVVYGTLLGIIRQGNYIPHDYDIDISLSEDSIDKL